MYSPEVFYTLEGEARIGGCLKPEKRTEEDAPKESRNSPYPLEDGGGGISDCLRAAYLVVINLKILFYSETVS